MAKKNFGDTLNGLLDVKPEKITAKGKKSVIKKPEILTKKGLKPGFTRSTLIVDEDHLKKLKAISFNDGVKLKEVIHAAFDRFITDYETKNGKVKIKSKGLRL